MDVRRPLLKISSGIKIRFITCFNDVFLLKSDQLSVGLSVWSQSQTWRTVYEFLKRSCMKRHLIPHIAQFYHMLASCHRVLGPHFQPPVRKHEALNLQILNSIWINWRRNPQCQRGLSLFKQMMRSYVGWVRQILHSCSRKEFRVPPHQFYFLSIKRSKRRIHDLLTPNGQHYLNPVGQPEGYP